MRDIIITIILLMLVALLCYTFVPDVKNFVDNKIINTPTVEAPAVPENTEEVEE